MNTRLAVVKTVLWALVGVLVAVTAARFLRGLGATENQNRPEPIHGSGSRCLSGVIGLWTAHCENGVRSLLQSISNQILQLPRLVAPGGQPRLVIALDEDARTT